MRQKGSLIETNRSTNRDSLSSLKGMFSWSELFLTHVLFCVCLCSVSLFLSVCMTHIVDVCKCTHIYVCVLACIGWRRGSLVGQSCSSHAWRCLMHRWTCAIVFDWPHCSRWSYLSLPPDTRASLAAYLLTQPPLTPSPLSTSCPP